MASGLLKEATPPAAPYRLCVLSDARSFTVPAVRTRFPLVAIFIPCLGRNREIAIRSGPDL